MPSRRPNPLATESDVLKAIAHPLRHRILQALNERVSSPKELADQLGEPLGRVSHHVRVLARLKAIEPVRTRHRRGAVEHFYRATMPTRLEHGEESTPSNGGGPSEVPALIDDVRAATGAGGFDHPRAHVSYTLLDLDDERLDRVDEILVDARQRLADVRAAAAERLERSGEEPIRTQVGILHFVRD